MEKNQQVTRKLQITQEMIQAAQEQKLTCLATVLNQIKNAKKVNINEPDPKNELTITALHQAAELGNLAIVQLLVNQRANIEARDNKGNTALHVATSQDHKRIVKLDLLRKSKFRDKKAIYNMYRWA